LAISKSPWYSRQTLWSLFLMCAFPLHAWTILLAFRDISWVTERSNMWDAIGVVSYGLIFAFVESLIIFFIAVLLGFLVSRHWEVDRRVVLLSILVLVDALWSMFSQYYFLGKLSLPEIVNRSIVESGHPIRILYTFIIPLVSFSALLPTYLILKSDKAFQFFRGLVERVTLLSLFYLFFDVIGLVIVIIRNI
jgi:hypothetical protein